MRNGTIHVVLSHAEALVFFDWLVRFNENLDNADKHIADQAEERVLFDLEATLETQLVEPLQSDYAAAVLKARASVRDGE